MSQQRLWWCDEKVDGLRVRVWYELDDLAQPGLRHTDWAPRKACYNVGWPNALVTRRWQLCTETEGCSSWFYP